jgi:hypothetical protein
MIQALLRKLNIRHYWHLVHAEDGTVYKRCRRCGKDDDQRGEGTTAISAPGQEGEVGRPQVHECPGGLWCCS